MAIVVEIDSDADRVRLVDVQGGKRTLVAETSVGHAVAVGTALYNERVALGNANQTVRRREARGLLAEGIGRGLWPTKVNAQVDPVRVDVASLAELQAAAGGRPVTTRPGQAAGTTEHVVNFDVLELVAVVGP